ncbi:MAG TPA: hypothetical protein VJH65_00365 [Candidatus Nanoarchaeia archaeon]|nr:hypothetical protein [Candidatus Nanoarchaeia archaeon]
MEKEGKIVFAEKKLKSAFEDIKEKDKEVYRQIEKAFEEISRNVFCGRNVKKNLIPKRFIKKYSINNLWIYNLPQGWRMLYSIATPDKIEIIALVLDWINHKDYEKLFGF